MKRSTSRKLATDKQIIRATERGMKKLFCLSSAGRVGTSGWDTSGLSDFYRDAQIALADYNNPDVVAMKVGPITVEKLNDWLESIVPLVGVDPIKNYYLAKEYGTTDAYLKAKEEQENE